MGEGGGGRGWGSVGGGGGRGVGEGLPDENCGRDAKFERCSNMFHGILFWPALLKKTSNVCTVRTVSHLKRQLTVCSKSYPGASDRCVLLLCFFLVYYTIHILYVYKLYVSGF